MQMIVATRVSVSEHTGGETKSGFTQKTCMKVPSAAGTTMTKAC